MAQRKKTPSILVRMYRLGTGDFFLLRLKKGKSFFKIVLDCGCINASETDFEPMVANLKKDTGGVIDLLIVTHEHDDHINGFIRAEKIFREFSTVKRAWFAWTESKTDPLANDLRANHTERKMALQAAASAFDKLEKDGYFKAVFQGATNLAKLKDSKDGFRDSLQFWNALNQPFSNLSADAPPTMEDRLRTLGVLRPETIVEFLRPGQTLEALPGAEGIRFLVLGPPRDLQKLGKEEQKGKGYEKRGKSAHEEPSLVDALAAAAVPEQISPRALPFDPSTIVDKKATFFSRTQYESADHAWRKIDHDWLLGAGDLALRLETSINNTSLVLAIQFLESERILLFPGDAEFGNWESWHDKDLQWEIPKDGEAQKVDAKYILKNTVFYKVGHHLSHNGTGKENGLDLMTNPDLTAMATLHLGQKKIRTVWRNTMPNDDLGLDLLKKTKGKLYFLGERNEILEKIPTHELPPAILENLHALNSQFDGKDFVEIEIPGK